jgi:acetyltransferase-like isoleucine patch superfamily enzyme
MIITDVIIRHPAFATKLLLQTPGYPLPNLEGCRIITVDAAGVEVLKSRGIKIHGEYGEGNLIVIHEELGNVDLNVHFLGKSNNAVVLEQCPALRGQIQFMGDGNLAIICRGWYKLKVEFADCASGLYIGPHSSVGDAYFWVQGDNRSITIGADCMLAWGIGLRTGDGHGVIDVSSRSITNTPKDITLGRHVWLAQDALIFKGVHIGSGSVIAARSIVTKNIPSCCVASGTPAGSY